MRGINPRSRVGRVGGRGFTALSEMRWPRALREAGHRRRRIPRAAKRTATL